MDHLEFQVDGAGGETNTDSAAVQVNLSVDPPQPGPMKMLLPGTSIVNIIIVHSYKVTSSYTCSIV